jgi:hypothetical protein
MGNLAPLVDLGSGQDDGWVTSTLAWSIPVREPFPAAAASLDAAVRLHRPSVGGARRSRSSRVRYDFAAWNEDYFGIDVDDALSISEQVDL